MPTISNRVRCLMVGTLLLWPPTAPVMCDGPAGKSLPIFRSSVKPIISENQKYSAFRFPQISGITALVSPRDEGRRPSSPTRGGMRWTPMP